MNAAQAIDFIHGAQYTGKKNGLENTRELLKELNLSVKQVPAIHVAGTNGKGSVCAMLNGMLMEMGYKVGLYTSPFLQHYQERIRVNGLPIYNNELINGVQKIKEASWNLEKKEISVTTFEIGTALALWYFEQEKVDVAIIESGLGGRFDSTNILMPKVSVITTIDYDHMAILGYQLSEIAYAKAGIIKKQIPVVVHPINQPEALEVIKKEAELKQAQLVLLNQNQIQNSFYEKKYMVGDFVLGKNEKYTFKIPFSGKYQGENALTALKTLELFTGKNMKTIYPKAFIGLQKVLWPGRLEYAKIKETTYLLEGAHNAQGLKGLRDHLEAYAPEKTMIVFGILEDKLNEEVLKVLKKLPYPFITVTINTPRSIKGEKLKQIFELQGIKVLAYTNHLQEAILLANENIGMDLSQGLVVIAGSLYLVGEGRTLLNLPNKVVKTNLQEV